jgi:hypothetical protein
MDNSEQHTNETIPWPVWLAVILLAGILGDASVRVFFSFWTGRLDGILWFYGFAGWSGHYLIHPGVKSRHEALKYFGVLTLMVLVTGILGATDSQSDERVIRAIVHRGEAAFILTLGAVCAVTWFGLRSSACDRYFDSAAPRITAHALVPLFIVFSLSSAYQHFSHYSESKYVQGMKPTIAQVFVRDSASALPLANIQMHSSQSALWGLDAYFRKKHQAFSGSTMIGKYQAAFVSIKTAIAEPMRLRFGSDGYEPAEVILQPGHEGRIELVLKPVAETKL